MSFESSLHSIAIGVASKNSTDELIEVYFPRPMLNPSIAVTTAIAGIVGYSGGNRDIRISTEQCAQIGVAIEALDAEFAELCDALQDSKKALVLVFIQSDQPPVSVAEVYLKLHLLSHRLCKPNSLNLQGAFGILHNLAWTNHGAISLEDLPARQLQARMMGQVLNVMSIDKFPRMSNYIVPAGVRIADAARVRLGAYLGDGTTVMHEGFVNFNAGTIGPAMIEGRISAGVIIGAGTDLGGGCSTMGTLSGGGKELISVGKDCLIGANSGLGFPLGDRCIIEAGLYVTAGTKVLLLDHDNNPLKVVKARELSGQSDLLFRRNSQTGAVECKANITAVALNADLHNNN
jgi:2,3,4,5-tetrahydropyridine-2,6-dicarboxylate N-succinyltransferase